MLGWDLLQKLELSVKTVFYKEQVSNIKNNTSMNQRFDVSAVGDGSFLIPFFFGCGSLHFYLASDLGNMEMNFD